MYLSLGHRAVLGDASAALAALGVAPLPVRLVWERSVLEPLATPASDPALYRQRVEDARLRAILIFGAPLVLAIVLWLAFSHGLAAAATAGTVVALSPNVVAHAGLATTDVAFTLAFVTAIAILIAYLRHPTWTWAAALAAALGVALATKYSAVGLFVIAGIAFALNWSKKRIGGDLAVIAGGCLAAWALHGWAVQPLFAADGFGATIVTRALGWTGLAPAVIKQLGSISWPIVLQGVAAQMNLEQRGQEAFLLGQVSDHGWWYFFPVATAMKSTPVELLAFVACALGFYWRGFRDHEARVVLIAIAVIGGFALISQRNLGVRYVLPIIVLMIAAGVAWAADRLRGKRWGPMAAALVVSAQAFSSLSMGSEQLAYFNAFAGGPANGYTRLVDSNLDWGQDLVRLQAWLTARNEARVGLAYFGSAPASAYGIRAVDWRAVANGSDPETRFVIVSATYLQGVFLCGDPFAVLRPVQPSDRIGYSLMAYDVRREEVRRALAAASVDSCAP